MTKLIAILTVVASFLLVAPIIESGAAKTPVLFSAVGTAADGGGE